MTYHFLHKLVMDGLLQKQSAGCDAVLSFVEEHGAHALKHTGSTAV